MIKKVTPEAVNVGDKKTGNKNGRDWTLWPVGIKVKDKWYNGAIFNQEDLDIIQTVSKEVSLDFFQQEYQGEMQWKFKVPGWKEQILARVEALETVVEALADQRVPTGKEPPSNDTPPSKDTTNDFPWEN